MARQAGSAQALRIPTKRDTGEEYDLAGSFHWSDWLDTPVRQFNTIWAIPLSAFGDEIQTEEGLEVPLCKNTNNQEYYLVHFDANYLKERFYREWVEALRWTSSTVRKFFEINEQWIEDRIAYFKKAELMEQAEHLAALDIKGRSAEFWYEQIVKMNEDESNDEIDERLEGVLEKLSNEYFICTAEKHRYKVKPDQLNSSVLPGGNILDLVGCTFKFEADVSNPPKSRQAKGWVTVLVVKE